jgi:hypothetical protein
VLRALRSRRTVALALPIAGALFWSALGIVFLLLVTAPLRRSYTAPADAAARAPLSAPAAAPAPAPLAPSTTAAARAASAPVASAAPSVTAVTPPAPDSRFSSTIAVRALDGRWRDIAKCRRGKTWGKAATTITFAGDGSISHVDVGAPFAGTPTADCIADQLGRVRIGAFGDDDATVVYRVYVAPR